MIKNMIRDMLTQMQLRKTDRVLQSTMSLFLYATLGAAVFAAFYTVLGFYQMAFPLALSGVLFLICSFLYINDMGKITTPISFASISIIVISTTYLAGLDYGGYYFILGAITLFACMESRIRTKVIYILLCLIEYVAVQVYFAHKLPVYFFSENTVKVFEQMNIWIAFGAVTFTLLTYSSAANKYVSRQKEIHTKINHLANSDLLTGIANRRGMYLKLDKLMAVAKETSGSFVMGLADIDDFKRINDTYGHPCGDEVLKYVSNLMQSTIRKSDFVGRWGGEEFLIVLPDTDLEKGMESLERVRETISQNVFNHNDLQIQVTVTIGAAVFRNNLTIPELIHRVDERMYSGKKCGKNCVIGVPAPNPAV